MGVNKVMFGDELVMDISDSTVTEQTLAKGASAYNASGEKITGVMPTESVLYVQQSLSEAQQSQARRNISAMDGRTDNLGNQIVANHAENLTIQVRDFVVMGRFCVFTIQAVVHTAITDDYGFTIFTLPRRASHRTWCNYEQRYYVQTGENIIRVNSGAGIPTGNLLLQGMFIAMEE